MSRKAASLRRIIRSIGTPTLPRAYDPRPHLGARDQHTTSHHATTTQDLGVFGLAPGKGGKQNKIVLDLLSSIRSHLDDDKVRNIPSSKGQDTRREGSKYRLAQRTVERTGHSPRATLDRLDKQVEVEQPDRFLRPEIEPAFTLESWHDDSAKHDYDLGTLLPQQEDDELGSSSFEQAVDYGTQDLNDPFTTFGSSVSPHVQDLDHGENSVGDDASTTWESLGPEPPSLESQSDAPNRTLPASYTPLQTARLQSARFKKLDWWDRKSIKPPSPTSDNDLAFEAKRRASHHPSEEHSPHEYILNVSLRETAKQRRLQKAQKQDERQRELHNYEEFPHDAQWLEAFSSLDDLTPKGIDMHVKRVETSSLPGESRLQLIVDRYEAHMRVLLNTGSTLRLQDEDTATDTFGSFTLTGTSTQNAAARSLMLDQGFFRVVDGTKATTGQAMEFITATTRTISRRETTSMDMEPLDLLRTLPEQYEQQDSQTRTSLYFIGGDSKLLLTPLLRAAQQGILLSSLQLNAAVEALTKAHTRKELMTICKDFRTSNPIPVIATALYELLTRQTNVANTTSKTLRTAWNWLLHMRHVSVARKLQHAHDDYAARTQNRSRRGLDTQSINALMRYCADARSIHQMRYHLASMKLRSVPANAETWGHFFRLTRELYPERSLVVFRKMHEIGVLEDTALRLELLRHYVAAELKKYVESGQMSVSAFSTRDWIHSIDKRITTPRWLKSKTAFEINAILLDHGNWLGAFEVCEEVAANQNKAHIALLHQLLDSTTDAGTAVKMLERFLQLPGVSPTDLQTATYERLFHIATRDASPNLVRAIWQHACCSGKVAPSMQERMQGSISRHRVLRAVVPRSSETFMQFWLSHFAVLAVGVGQRKRKMFSPRYAGGHTRALYEQRSTKARTLMAQDLMAVGHVSPVRSLVEDAIAAVRMDVGLAEWLGHVRKRRLTESWFERVYKDNRDQFLLHQDLVMVAVQLIQQAATGVKARNAVNKLHTPSVDHNTAPSESNVCNDQTADDSMQERRRLVEFAKMDTTLVSQAFSRVEWRAKARRAASRTTQTKTQARREVLHTFLNMKESGWARSNTYLRTGLTGAALEKRTRREQTRFHARVQTAAGLKETKSELSVETDNEAKDRIMSTYASLEASRSRKAAEAYLNESVERAKTKPQTFTTKNAEVD